MTRNKLSPRRIIGGTVLASTLAMASILGSALPASAWGNAFYGAYSGNSQIQTSTLPFPRVLTFHENTTGTNYVSVQIRTNTGANVAGPKVAGKGTVSYQATTTYIGQVGGRHQGSSSTSGTFNS